MRRTTLGPVTHSGLNARPSMGAPRPPKGRSGLGAIKPGDERRQSAMPSYGGGSRRATSTAIVGRRATSTAVTRTSTGTNPARPGSRLSSRPSMSYSNRPGMRSDPRPLHDKHYMQQCVKALISFVIDRGYDQPISPKILTNPSSRDFQHIFLFLVRSISPTFVFQKRFEDEVPVILRCLGYPFAISKSALSAVGSPHTWPSLLGVLTWLMGFLKYDEEKKERENSDQELDPIARRMQIFYDNMVQAYEQFLLGADTFPELDNEFNQHFDAENKRRQEEIAKLQADRDELAAMLESLQTQPSPLVLTREHRVSLETNIHKFELLIPSLIEHKNSIHKKSSEKEAEGKKEETEFTTLSEEKQKLLDSVAVQEEAGIDAERLVADRERLRQRLAKLGTQRSQVESEQRGAEQKLAEAYAALDDDVRKYHKLTAMLQPVAPQTATDWEIIVSRDAAITEPEKILSKNIETDILKAVRDLKEQVSSTVPALQEESLSFQERIDEAEERLIVQRSELSLLESRKSNLEGEYQNKRSAITNQLEARKLAILQGEEQMTKALNDSQEQRRKADEQLQQARDVQRANREELVRNRRRLVEVALQDIQLFQRHMESVTHDAHKIRAYFEREGAFLAEEKLAST